MRYDEDMLSRRYQQSRCKGNWLHKWKLLYPTREGVLERCERCGLKMHFENQASLKYLSYHIREVLKKSDPIFAHEYPHIKD